MKLAARASFIVFKDINLAIRGAMRTATAEQRQHPLPMAGREPIRPEPHLAQWSSRAIAGSNRSAPATGCSLSTK